MYIVPNNCKAVLRIQPANFKREDFSRISEPTSTTMTTESSSSEPNSSSSPLLSSPSSPTASDTDTKKDGNSSNNKKNKNSKKNVASEREYGGDNDGLIYKSGIPTLRSSAHRVKFDMKSRKHDPKPRDREGKETKTTWLPDPLLKEDVFDYDLEKYDRCNAIILLLQSCDPDIVGLFVATSSTEAELLSGKATTR